MASSKPTLHVVIGSTRPGRVGEPIARWFFDQGLAHDGFEVELIDLAVVNLPLFNEPVQPFRQQYTHEHTKRWSETVSRADAFSQESVGDVPKVGVPIRQQQLS